MNTDKLIKAIQILVKEEVKAVLPTLVKEAVRIETAKLLKENKQLREALKPQKPVQSTFMDTPVVETIMHTQPQKSLSKNPVLNDILNQTKPFNAPINESQSHEEWRSVSYDSSMVDTVGRASIAEKMGYGDMIGGQRQGLGVQTGVPALDKALNRDYSQLIKAMDKKNGPWRPGMD
jgi:hypothetical protein